MSPYDWLRMAGAVLGVGVLLVFLAHLAMALAVVIAGDDE